MVSDHFLNSKTSLKYTFKDNKVGLPKKRSMGKAVGTSQPFDSLLLGIGKCVTFFFC